VALTKLVANLVVCKDALKPVVSNKIVEIVPDSDSEQKEEAAKTVGSAADAAMRQRWSVTSDGEDSKQKKSADDPPLEEVSATAKKRAVELSMTRSENLEHPVGPPEVSSLHRV